MINVSEWINSDPKRFIVAILNVVLFYTLCILDRVSCVLR